jgi:ribosomal protein S18 acetylase RimI-like enzyme
MIVRDFRPSDFRQVMELWASTGIYNEVRGDTAESINHCNTQGGRFLVLEDPETGTIAGTSWMTYDGRRVHLHHFAIGPRLQGQGWGRALVLESLKFARQKGCPVKLEVQRDNHRAVQLYRSLGFTELGNYDLYILLDPTLPE